MTSSDILSEFKPADIKAFKKDFTQTIIVGSEIDSLYKGAHSSLDSSISKYEKLAEKFNKKYKGIVIKPKKSVEHFKAEIYIKEAGIKDFLANSASRIQGLKSVGSTSFNQIDAGDAERFAKFLDSLMDKVYISYADAENGASTIAAVLDRSKKGIRLIYSPDEIINENSAGFKICAFYALKRGYNKKIDIYSEALTFGFSRLLNEVEKREWHDKFAIYCQPQ